jgi:hypothetical protein
VLLVAVQEGLPLGDAVDTSMPAYIPDDSEESRLRRLKTLDPGFSGGTMPPMPASPASAAPGASVSPLTGRSADLAIGATSQPKMPPMLMGPSQPVGDLAPKVSGNNPTMPAMPLPNEQPQKPLASVAASQSMPAAPVGKEMQRYQDLTAQGEPKLTGWKKVMDVIGSFLPYGKAVERQISGTPQNFDTKLAMQAARASQEQGLESGEQKLQAEPREAELRQRNTESEISARGLKDTQTLAKYGLTRDENGQVVPDENSPVYKGQQQKLKDAETAQANLQTYRQSQIELNNARAEVERAKNDPNSPAYQQAQQKLQMAQRAHDIAAANLGLHQQEFGLHQEEYANKVHEQGLVKPSGQAASRGSAAQAALDILPELQAQIKKNAKSLGPLMGRLQRGEIAIGNVDPKIAKLYSALTSFYALNPAIHGFRNFEFVKDMPSFIGGLERDPEATIAGLEGLKPTLQSVAKEGKTYHRRIVEGEEGNGPKPPDGKTTVYDPKGVPHFVNSASLEKFLKDPKYKGWSKNAPAAK